MAKYEMDGINRLQNKKFRPAGTTQGSSQTGNWNTPTTWQSGVLPLANDNVTINIGQIVTIPNGQSGSAGILNDKGVLKNFGTLNMGKIANADLYVESLKYHIRGGLRGKNLDASDNLTNSLFSFKIEYEGNNGFFDGNIKNQYWKSSIDGIQRAYQYNYDIASRLLSGSYGSMKAGEDYSLNGVTYDFNSNITTLSRNGYKSNNTFGLIDNLGYAYQTNSNKIQSVSDNSGEIASFTDATGSTDYTYYLDGSLKSDANKGISLIEYNYLKLPKKVVQNGVTTLIQYDASGKKLKETIGTQVTDYVGNTIYKNSLLYQISHGEGRIINGEYEYSIKDHLGNLRVAFRDSLGVAKITQSNAYGCFGEDLPTLSYFKSTWKKDFFKFTGKEELQGTGYIDFGARWYDNIVPRFTTIDPLAELSRRFSPTVYANGNPLRFTDPDGMSAVGADGLTDEQWVRNQGDDEKNKESQQENRDKENGKTKKSKTDNNYTAGTRLLGTANNADKKDSFITGGLALAAGLAADDVTGIGVADDVAIPFVLAGVGVYAFAKSEIVQKMSKEIDAILKKAIGPSGFVYELRVLQAGLYADVRGIPITLNAGDIWKFGETTNNIRYSRTELDKMVPGGVKLTPVFFGNQSQIKVMEKYLIYGYFFNHGTLPPGNKIFR